MPKVNPNESEADFVSRYMSSEEARKKYPDEKQRAAIAYSEYKKKSVEGEFMVKMPVTKCWEESVDVQKSVGGVEKSTQRFIEVTMSGLKEDRQGDRMDQSAINDMISQFKSGTIPFFPDHGFHEQTGQKSVYSWKQMMGVFVDARQEGDKLPAVIRLNKAHPDHELFWKYIKEESMPIGFSIGGRALSFKIEEVED